MKFFSIKIALTALITVILITLINVALFKIDSGNFTINAEGSLFDFFNYTIYSVIPDGTDITPKSLAAKTVRIFSTLAGVFILTILIAVFFSVGSEKYKEDVIEVINFSDDRISQIQNYIIEKYAIPANEAINELLNAKSALANAISEIHKMTINK